MKLHRHTALTAAAVLFMTFCCAALPMQGLSASAFTETETKQPDSVLNAVSAENAKPESTVSGNVSAAAGSVTLSDDETPTSGYCGDPSVNDGKDVTWSLEDGVLTISGSGAMRTYSYWPSYTPNTPWYHYHESKITQVIIEDGVTSIGSYAFYKCENLTSVTIPDSVTSIGDCAFGYCSSLTSVTIPDSVTSIGEGAFSACKSLVSATISNGVKIIAPNMFNSCWNLTSVTIPNSVKIIKTFAFYDCTSLTSINIPDSVTTIGTSAFHACKALTSVTIPDSVTRINSSAFYLCTSLANINIPDSVTSIGDCAFGYCRSLTSVTIPNSITSIADCTFAGCSGLTSVTIPDSVTSIGNAAFYGCSGLTSVTIPNSVTSIGYNAFCECSGLTSVTIPDSVTSIGYGAFFGYRGLTTVIILNPSCVINEHNNYNYIAFPSHAAIYGYPNSPAQEYAKKHNYTFVPITAATFIIAQPKDASGFIGDKVQFSVSAVSAVGEALSYQWQYFNTATNKWENTGLTGNKTPTLTVTVTSGRNNMKYHCIVKDTNGIKLISDAAILKVPKIVTQPQSVSETMHSMAEFTVEATGFDLTYQWQYYNKSTKTWEITKLTGNQTATLTVPVTAGRNMMRYRCVINNKIISSAATLYVIPKIITQPQSVTAKLGTKVKLSVEATGANLIYQWQYYNKAERRWYNTKLSGNQTNTLTVPVTQGRDGMMYWCIVKDATNGTKVYSGAATVRVK